MTENSSAVGANGLNSAHVELFVADLKVSGYAECKLGDKRQILLKFVRWTQALGMQGKDIDESSMIEFLESAPQPSKDRLAFKQMLLRSFLRHLRVAGVVPDCRQPYEDIPVRRLELEYGNYLRDERGLSHKSLLVYLPYVRTFLAECAGNAAALPHKDLDARAVRMFLLNQVESRSSQDTRLLAVALRSFLHFLFLRGRTQLDLAFAITAVRRPRATGTHAFLSPSDVEKVLSTPDLATPMGQCDHAILLLLARLGLRAAEVVALKLADISWRTGEFVVHGKGRVQDRLPLLRDVGASLALYIQSGRGQSRNQHVFLRCIAPRIALAGPCAIDSVVCRALTRAGLQKPPHVAAHLLRHSLATQMVHRGASLPEISQVLRHRSPATTQIYAKVAFESLREVTSPWPEGDLQ